MTAKVTRIMIGAMKANSTAAIASILPSARGRLKGFIAKRRSCDKEVLSLGHVGEERREKRRHHLPGIQGADQHDIARVASPIVGKPGGQRTIRGQRRLILSVGKVFECLNVNH